MIYMYSTSSNTSIDLRKHVIDALIWLTCKSTVIYSSTPYVLNQTLNMHTLLINGTVYQHLEMALHIAIVI